MLMMTTMLVNIKITKMLRINMVMMTAEAMTMIWMFMTKMMMPMMLML
jgi:hypothetical protein